MWFFTGNETTTVGNETTTDGDIDYYAAFSFPYYAKVDKGSSHFLLNISIFDDNICEANELFRVIVVGPDNCGLCTVDVVIVDNGTYVNDYKLFYNKFNV